MYNVDQKKWNQFAADTQLQNIAAEIARATHASLHTKESGNDWAQKAYERALGLIDASIADPKWKNRRMLYELRDAVASVYVGESNPAINRILYRYLVNSVT